MKLSYFKDTDTLYIELRSTTSAYSNELQEGVVLDYDSEDKITGIEIENASSSIDLSKLDLMSLPVESK
jgi:uncharacterized protein YuzE